MHHLSTEECKLLEKKLRLFFVDVSVKNFMVFLF